MNFCLKINQLQLDEVNSRILLSFCHQNYGKQPVGKQQRPLNEMKLSTHRLIMDIIYKHADDTQKATLNAGWHTLPKVWLKDGHNNPSLMNIHDNPAHGNSETLFLVRPELWIQYTFCVGDMLMTTKDSMIYITWWWILYILNLFCIRIWAKGKGNVTFPLHGQTHRTTTWTTLQYYLLNLSCRLF